MTTTRRLCRDVVESLRSQPARIGLSFFAVMTGIVVLTLLLALLQGLRNESRRLVASLGADVIAAQPDAGAIQRDGFRGLEAWSRHIEANLEPVPSALMIRLNSGVSDGGDAPVWAAGRRIAEVRGWRLVEGRMIDAMDEETGARVLVLTEALRLRSGLGIGSLCQIGGHTFTVIGIMREGGGVPSDSGQDTKGHAAMAVVSMAAASLNELPVDPSSAAIFIKTDDQMTPARVIDRIDRLMQDPAWITWLPEWITPETLLRGIREWQRVIGFTAGSIALLCLLLGGTTLMSLMLAEVRQRVPEIGLRRSIGATRRDIALLFVAESVLVTVAAALAGIVAASLLLSVMARQGIVPIGIDYFTFVIPVFVSIVIGGVFSFWPARLAAGLSPAMALRNA